jgi:hypothetical protein
MPSFIVDRFFILCCDVFEVSLLVEVRLRGSLSARSAIRNPGVREHPCRFRRARCFVRFLITREAELTATKFAEISAMHMSAYMGYRMLLCRVATSG